MAAQHYCADSENGDHVDDPSEDALFMLISDLNDADNTFVVIQPDEDEPAWFASVAVLDEGSYEVVRRDTNRREHDVSVETAIGRIASDLTKKLARWSVRTAWTRLVIRVVEQRSLRRIRQDLRVAMACSTSARTFAWDRLTAC